MFISNNDEAPDESGALPMGSDRGERMKGQGTALGLLTPRRCFAGLKGSAICPRAKHEKQIGGTLSVLHGPEGQSVIGKGSGWIARVDLAGREVCVRSGRPVEFSIPQNKCLRS
jgi:hypothetical protein